MAASRLPFSKDEQAYFANNIVNGFGKGTSSLANGIIKGISGIVTEPLKGGK